MKRARWFGRGGTETETAAHALYMAVVQQARRPEFYEAWRVPDTVDGRFDLIILHAFLVMHRLKGEGEAAAKLSQALFDVLFGDMDRALREMGVGDLGIGRQIRRMMEACHGRVIAYDAGLGEPDDESLTAALVRNIYRGEAPATVEAGGLTAYLRREVATLAARPLSELLSGGIAFGPPPLSRKETEQ